MRLWRSLTVDVTCVPMVVSVLPTTATALSTPVVPDAPLTAVWIVSTSLLRFVDNWLSEVCACCPAAVSGLPRPFRSVASVWVAAFASLAALVMPALDGLLVTEVAAVVIDPFHVVIAEQTPVAHVSVADAPVAGVVVVAVVVVAVVVVLLLEEPQPAADTAISATDAAIAARRPMRPDPTRRSPISNPP